MKEILSKYFKITETNDVEIFKTPMKGRMILKILALVSAILFFVPLCTVSCSGQSTKINGLKATFGFNFYSQKIDGNLSVIFLLIIPLIIVTALFIKNIYMKKYIYIAIVICAVIDLIILLSFRSKVVETVKYYSSQVKFNSGFYINILVNLMLLGISALIAIILYLDQILSLVTINTATSQYQYGTPHINSHSNSEGPTSIVERNCLNCGVLMKPEDIFCMQCGTKYEKEEGSLNNFCMECGAEIVEGSNFCNKCGKKFSTV